MRPCYYITDGDGIDETAYVSNPAILVKGIALEENTQKKMSFSDKLKLQVAAPVLIPDLKIYRYDDDLGEYDVVFSKERILQLHTKQKLEGKGDNFNLDHSDIKAKSVILYEWIVEDPNTDQSVIKYGLDPLPQGTLFRVTQFPEDQREFFIKEIVEGNRAGFSIEGYLGLELERIKEKIKQSKTNTMKQKFEMAKLKDGTPIWISENGEVYVIDENMERVPIFDGEHILTSGEIIATVNGKITERRKETEAEADEEAPKDDIKCEDEPASVSKEEIVSIIKPMLDDIYSKIAELQTAIETAKSEEIIEDESDPSDYKKSKSKMSSVDSLVSFINGIKK